MRFIRGRIVIPPDDVLAGLPAPLDDEPPSVRQDIADELADHLACAYRRELLKTADEDAAQQRVLDRFGNPQRIAYQLWFQALWGRIMLSRFARVWQGLKIVGGIVVLFLVFRMADQQSMLSGQLQLMTASYNSMQSQAMGTRNLLEQVLQRLPEPPPSVDPDGMPMGGGDMGGGSPMMGMSSSAMAPGAAGGESSNMTMPGMSAGATSASAVSKPDLIVRLTMEGTNNEPVPQCVIAVLSEQGQPLQMMRPMPDAEGMSMGGMPGMMAGSSYPPASQQIIRQASVPGDLLTEDSRGVARFLQKQPNQSVGAIEPGRYTIYVEFHDGRQAQRLVVIPPSAKAVNHTEHIVCPAPSQKAYVVIHTPVLPQDLIDAGLSVVASVKRKSTIIAGTEWQTGNSADDLFLDFDPKTGAPTQYDRNSGNYTSFYNYYASGNHRARQRPNKFGALATEHRFIKLPSGDYEVTLGWWNNRSKSLIFTDASVELENSGLGGIPFSYAAAGAAENGVLTISADTRDVLLDFPKEMLDGAQKALAAEWITKEAQPALNPADRVTQPTTSTSEPAKP